MTALISRHVEHYYRLTGDRVFAVRSIIYFELKAIYSRARVHVYTYFIGHIEGEKGIR